MKRLRTNGYPVQNPTVIFLCGIVALFCELFSSVASPFHSVGHTDMDIMFTVGKGIFKGLIPYVDLFDQKGPIQFLLYGIASLIQYDGYLGVFVIETVIVTIGLFWVFKIASLYVNSKASLMLTAFFGIILNLNFEGGSAGQVETLALPIYAYAIYVMIVCLRDTKLPGIKQSLFIGMSAGILLFSKFSLLGFYAGFLIVPFVMSVKSKQIKEFVKSFLFVMLGVMLVSIPIFTIYIVTGNLQVFIDGYFLNNISGYNDYRYPWYLKYLLSGIRYYTIMFSYVITNIGCVLYATNFKGSRRIRSGLLLCALGTFLLLFAARIGWTYYYKAFAVYNIFGLIAIYRLVSPMIINLWSQGWKKKVTVAIMGALVISVLCVISIYGNNRYLKSMAKRSAINSRIETDILSVFDKNEVVLSEYACMNCGIYTDWGLLPTNKYFTHLNSLEEEYRIAVEGDIMAKIPNAILSGVPIDYEGYYLLNTYQDAEAVVNLSGITEAYLYVRK